MRSPSRVSGRVTLTEGERRKLGNASNGVLNYPPSSIGLTKQTFTFTTGDWTADGDYYYVDCSHNLRSIRYIVQVVNTDTSQDIFPEMIHRAPSGDTDVCRIYLADNTRNITVIIV